MTTPREFLQSLTTPDLLAVVDTEIGKHGEGVPERMNLVDLLAQTCPELIAFSSAVINLLIDHERLTEEQYQSLLLSHTVVLGAIYKAAENRDLPQL